MLCTSPPEELVEIQLAAETSIQTPDADINLGPQRCQRVDLPKQLAPEFLLRRFGELGRLGDRQF